jgi:RecA/RadA recombinase
MVSEYRRLTQRVQTPLAHLTGALLGGFGPTIYEAAGPAGAGKTQFALSTVAAAVVSSLCAPPATTDAGGAKYVVYVDTEGAFDAARLREIIEARLLHRMSCALGAEPQSIDEEGGIRAGGPEAFRTTAGADGRAEESPRRAIDLDNSIVDATKPTPFDRQAALNGALAAVLQRVIVYQATSVAEVARICAELPDTISVSPVDLDTISVNPVDLDCASDATADSAAAAPVSADSGVGEVLPSAVPRAPTVDAKLGLVVIDSIASASRKEFDAAAGGAAGGGGGTGAAKYGWQGGSGLGSLRGAVGGGGDSSSGGYASGTTRETATGFAWQRSDALTRLASVLKGICERHLVPVLVTNQIATAVPPARSARSAFLGVAAAADDGDEEGGADAFAEWAGTWLEETLVPALGPIWSHSVVS